MSIGYILSQTGFKIGLNPQEPSQRAVLLRYVNEASAELYSISDMAGSLVEQVFKVNGDQTISLPNYVGQVRAMREHDTFIPWHLNQLRPRYNESNWPDMWRNFRLKGLSPAINAVRNESLLTVTVPTIENPPIVVTLSGPTINATNISESLVMDALTKTGVNAYIEYSAFIKNVINTVDVTITDADGTVISVIPNNELDAKYQIIDVSQAPWLNLDTGTLDHYLEILYKKKLPTYLNDSDEFIANGYDNVLVNKVLQLYYEEQGKVDIATAYATKARLTLANIHEDASRGTEDVVALVSNPHDCLNPRIGSGRHDNRYGGGYMAGRYGYY